MNLIVSKTLQPGDRWSADIGKNRLIRFTALGDGANLGMLMYNSRKLSEHYNAPDTMKAQHSFYLTKGFAIISDMGRAMAGIVEDEVGWHDTVSGYTTRKMTDEKYGVTTYQEQSNNYLKSGQENFLNELLKNGMSKKDLMPPVNFFSKVDADQQGNLIFDPNNCKKEMSVLLRTEMEVYMILSNTPNPLDPATKYPSVPIRVEIMPAEPADGMDVCVNHSKYTRRAYENTWEYNNLLGI